MDRCYYFRRPRWDSGYGCRGCGQYGRSGCVWLYAVMACPGMVPSAPIWKPLPAAHSLTSDVPACQVEPVMSARGCRARAMLDGLGDKVGGAPCPFHGKLGEHGAGELIDGAAGLLAFQHPHGLGEFFQAEAADWVVEQAALGA